MSYVEYNYLLCEISQRVDQLNQRKLVFLMCKGRVAPRAQDIPDALFLFQELQDQNKLAIDQVEPLKELLKAIGEWPLFQKVRKFEDKRKEYKELLELISSALDESNQLQQLIAACTERVTLEESERNSQTARILFEKLEGRELFEFGRLRFLKEILSKIQRQDLVKEIQDFEKRRIDEDDFERWKAQAGDIVQVVRDTGGRIIGALDMKTVCRALGSGLTLLSARAIMNGWSTYDQLVTGIQTCVLPAGLKLIGMGTGCVCFTIQADNLMGLTALWNMYEDGTLKKRLFDFFVTDEMRTLAGGEENVELTVTIGKKEYEKVYLELLREADASTLPPGAAAADASSTKTFGGTTPSSAAVTSRTAAVDKEVEYVTQKLGSSLGSGDKRDTQTIAGDDWNSLSSAVQTGNFAIIEDMLSRGLDINTKNNDGNTALILAASTGKIDAVNYLLDKGADPFIVGHFGITPLHAALKDDNVTIIETLMSRGLDVDLKDSGGRTPLMWAAVCGKVEAVNYLLDNGADPSIRDQSGRNLLHTASEGGNVTIIETLVSRGLDVVSKDSTGWTPLMWAAFCGKIEAVNYLLDKGADPSIRDQLGRNLLHTASGGGNVTIIETLMSR